MYQGLTTIPLPPPGVGRSPCMLIILQPDIDHVVSILRGYVFACFKFGCSHNVRKRLNHLGLLTSAFLRMSILSKCVHIMSTSMMINSQLLNREVNIRQAYCLLHYFEGLLIQRSLIIAANS